MPLYVDVGVPLGVQAGPAAGGTLVAGPQPTILLPRRMTPNAGLVSLVGSAPLVTEGSGGGARTATSLPVFGEDPADTAHVFEDWSTYATPASIASTARVDGGDPWEVDDASKLTLESANLDPWVGQRAVAIDLQDAPGAGAAHQRGFSLTRNGADDKYLNRDADQDAIVIEWAFRFTGTKWYEGKVCDYQPGRRYNMQPPSYDPLGLQAGTTCATDPLRPLFYDCPAQTPKTGAIINIGDADAELVDSFIGSTPLPGGNDVCFYKPNMGCTNSIGLWEQNNFFVNGPWVRQTWRFTKGTAGSPPNNGRIEHWLTVAGQAPVKVMEFFGDAGQLCENVVWVQSDAWFPDGVSTHFYHLTAVFDIFAGGNTTHIGYFRMWSHPKVAL